MLDLKGTPDDPSGYAKFRAFMISASDRLDGLGVDAAERMRAAATFVGLPSEWLGESAFAINAALAEPGLPTDFVAELRNALDAIREGFRRVGTEPTF